MKLRILSDLHIEFDSWPWAPPPAEADIVVLAGDIDTGADGVQWAKQSFPPDRPVIYVAGNHEYYHNKFTVQHIHREMKEAAAGSHVHVLFDEVLVLGDVRFLAGTLWTDFKLHGNPVLAAELARARMNDYRAARVQDGEHHVRRLQPQDTLGWHRATKAFLKRELAKPWAGKTVVITHHSPCEAGVPPQFRSDPLTPAFASNLEDLMGPAVDLWIYGHTHECRDFTLHGTRIVSNQRGYYPEALVPDFDGGFVVEI